MSRRWRLPLRAQFSQGGGIGLEPVYAAEALTLYKETSGNVTTSVKSDTVNNTAINELTVGGVTIGSEGDFTGIMVGAPSSSEYVMITKTDVHATNSLIAPTITTGLARMEQGNIIAKESLRIGYEYDNTTETYKNIKFAVDGETGNVKTEGSLEVASNATVGGTLGVTGKTTLKDELRKVLKLLLRAIRLEPAELKLTLLRQVKLVVLSFTTVELLLIV